MTARWVVDEVVPARDVRVRWEPISLYFKNEPAPDDSVHDRVLFTHRLLRVLEAVRAASGDDADRAMGELYYELGRRIHHDRDRDFTAAEALRAVGLDPGLAEAAHDESWDTEIRSRMDAGLALTGEDVGTPILAVTNASGERAGYFGPVITRVPPTEDSLAMWDALVTMMGVDGFWELKRTRTEAPDFGERP